MLKLAIDKDNFLNYLNERTMVIMSVPVGFTLFFICTILSTGASPTASNNLVIVLPRWSISLHLMPHKALRPFLPILDLTSRVGI